MNATSYKEKTFIVDDPQARIRQPDDLLSYVESGSNGQPKTIPQGTQVRITDAKVGPNKLAFVLVDGYGWTSASNIKGDMLNETLGRFAPPIRSPQGPNAIWEGGVYKGQATLVAIVGDKNQVEMIREDYLDAYLQLVAAAKKDGITVALESGFRSYPEQAFLYDGYKKRRPGFHLAARPGTSKHQNGKAYDLNAPAFDGHPVYDWLKRNAPKFGFVRTVSGEPWHWQYEPALAAKLAALGQFKAANVRR